MLFILNYGIRYSRLHPIIVLPSYSLFFKLVVYITFFLLLF